VRYFARDKTLIKRRSAPEENWKRNWTWLAALYYTGACSTVYARFTTIPYLPTVCVQVSVQVRNYTSIGSKLNSIPILRVRTTNAFNYVCIRAGQRHSPVAPAAAAAAACNGSVCFIVAKRNRSEWSLYTARLAPVVYLFTPVALSSGSDDVLRSRKSFYYFFNVREVVHWRVSGAVFFYNMINFTFNTK
jgi:hypothetical protein